MHSFINQSALFIFLFLISINVYSKTTNSNVHLISPPLRIPLLLSGNFAELRSNHFHSGLDFKTQGVVGKPVYSISEGYVSRVVISPWGYGKAIYINHPDGKTTVYAHLDRFASPLDTIIKKKQYQKESFEVDLSFAPNKIKIKTAQQIAFSGNSGSSGGPHLHFEIRDTKTQDPVNPFPYFMNKITDTQKPRVKAVVLYSFDFNNEKQYVNIVTHKNVVKALSKPISGWGKVALGIKAFDYMNNTHNIFGIYSMKVFVDGKLIFSNLKNRFSFDETRYLNSYIDLEEFRTNRRLIMRNYIEPGNKLSTYTLLGQDGRFTINQERTYQIRYILEDNSGNKEEFHFSIKGVKRNIEHLPKKETNLFYYNRHNSLNKKDITLSVPQGVLYSNIDFRYTTRESSGYYSKIHSLHSPFTPLHRNCNLSVKVDHDTLTDKTKYTLVRIFQGRKSAVASVYKKGYLEAKIRDLGDYAVAADLTSPRIKLISPQNWGKNQFIKIQISDNLSGIKKYRVEIDGMFALFDYDGKNALLSYRVDPSKIKKGKNHLLKIMAMDGCGNKKEVLQRFYW